MDSAPANTELSQLTARRPSRSATDVHRPTFAMTPLDEADDSEAVAASSGVDVGMTAPARRSSRSDALRPAFGFGMTPMVADTEAVEEDEAVGISTAVPTESIAKRRASRSQSFKDLQQPTIAVPSLSAIKPLDTPPADEFMLNLASDPYAPAPGTSLPPTPNELSFEEREIGTPGSEAASPGLADQQYFTQLPPVDRGRHAYMFLAAAIVLEASIWGLPFSVGVLHEYWSSELFANSNAESTLTLVSTLPTGLLFLSGTVLGPCFTMFPWYERHIQYAGIFVATLGLLTSAFVTQPWQLLLTFGVLYPFSAATYLPIPTNIFEWFHARRGLASGIMYSGTSLGGTIYPLVTTALLKKFGYKTTMIALALSFLLLTLAALPFAKRRIPLVHKVDTAGKRRHERPKLDWSFLRKSAPWVAFAFMAITSLANFIPLLWLPTYATAINATSPNGASILAITNATTCLGYTLAGFLSDRVSIRMAVMATTTVASIVCVTLWGFATNGVILCMFAVLWGVSGGSLAGYWGKMITIIARDDPPATIISYSTFLALKGIGSLTSGPISDALLKYPAFQGASGAYGSTTYGALLIYTAVLTFVGGLVLIAFPRK